MSTNFLEQLAAEWYEYSEYFVRTNVRARPLPKGGYGAELDVLAFKPSDKELIHIETSGDTDAWGQRKTRFIKKFNFDHAEYEKILRCSLSNIKRIAIVGWARTAKADLHWGENIEVLLIPEFLSRVMAGLHQKDFMSAAVPESYPILRTIQMVDNYQDLMAKK